MPDFLIRQKGAEVRAAAMNRRGDKGPLGLGDRLSSQAEGKAPWLTYLVTGGDAAHHVLHVPDGRILLEVPREGLHPLGQQLEQFGAKLLDPGLQGKVRGCLHWVRGAGATSATASAILSLVLVACAATAEAKGDGTMPGNKNVTQDRG